MNELLPYGSCLGTTHRTAQATGGSEMKNYVHELSVVEKRWERRDQFNKQFRMQVASDNKVVFVLYGLACIVPIPADEWIVAHAMLFGFIGLYMVAQRWLVKQ